MDVSSYALTRRPCRPFNAGSRSVQFYLQPALSTHRFMSDSLQLRFGKLLVIPVGMRIKAFPWLSAGTLRLRSFCVKDADLVFDGPEGGAGLSIYEAGRAHGR